jgi:hypothetical protein
VPVHNAEAVVAVFKNRLQFPQALFYLGQFLQGGFSVFFRADRPLADDCRAP